MFDFREKKLQPMVKKFIDNIDEILKTEDPAQKAEKLLAAKEGIDSNLTALADREEIKGEVSVVTVPVGLLCLAGLALCGFPVLAVASLFCSIAVGLLGSCTWGANRAQVLADRHTLDQKLDQEMLAIISAHPQDIVKAPRIMQALKSLFNGAAAEVRPYEDLRARVAAPAIVAGQQR